MNAVNAVDPKCRWCGRLLSEHLDSRPAGAPVPRVPCTGLKSGFMGGHVQDLLCECGRIHKIVDGQTFVTCSDCGRVARFDGLRWGPGEPPEGAQADGSGILATPYRNACDHKFIDSPTCLKCGWDPRPTGRL